jgi:4-amino-4-deoxy-L-arabinose transferase-like glycosyltransferase
MKSKLAKFWWLLPLTIVAIVLLVRNAIVQPALSVLSIVDNTATMPMDEHVFQGSLAMPRGGPYIIGFYSESSAQLTVGSHRMAGRGLVQQRIIFDASTQPIRFTGSAHSRLMWSPPGRRGDMEYLPASSISAAPPAQAQFGDDAGRHTIDGVCALLLLVTVVTSAVYAARRRMRNVTRGQWLAMAILFALALAIRLFDLSGAGQTWDEDANWAAGRNYISNLLSFDFSTASWQWNYEHPPVMKYLMGIGAQLSDGFGPARVISAIIGGVSAALMMPLVGRLFGWKVGGLAGLIASLLPPLIAHSKVVGHESPTVLWWTLGLLLAITSFDNMPREEAIRPARFVTSRLVSVGIVLGIAVASRFVNVLLGPLLGMALVLAAPPELRKKTAWWGAILLPLIAFATLVLLWPRLWGDPIGQLIASWHKLNRPHGIEPYLGEMTNHPHPTYFVVYLFATTPVLVLILAGVGLAVGAKFALTAIFRKLDAHTEALSPVDHVRHKAHLILLAWLLVPLLVMASPVRQDGVRYILPSVAAIAALAAVGLAALATRLLRRVAQSHLIAAVVIALYLGVVDARIHPYYLDYFGEQVGGSATVARRGWFETAWWGEGVDRAVHYVNEHAAINARVYRDCIAPIHLAWFRGDLWNSMADTAAQADWIVVYSPASTSCPLPSNAQLRYSVTGSGMVLATVYQIDR